MYHSLANIIGHAGLVRVGGRMGKQELGQRVRRLRKTVVFAVVGADVVMRVRRVRL